MTKFSSLIAGRLLCRLQGARSPSISSQVFPCLACHFSSQGETQKGHVLSMSEVGELTLKFIAKKEEMGKIEPGIMQKIASSQEELPVRQPSDSFSRAIVPLGSDAQAREKYLTINQGLRFGRVLEDFDSLAVLLCYKHNLNPDLPANQKSPLVHVTALVDQIEINPSIHPLSPFKDIHYDGKVTWVGKTSMECTMNLVQEVGEKMQQMIKAKYLFVARNPRTKKSAFVNRLEPKTPEDKELFREGEKSKARRIEEGKKSLLKIPPSRDEGLLIHDIFLSTVDLGSGRLSTRVKPENTVWMKDTILKTLIICQPEYRNSYNKIFGGFLMRKAFELAWTTAALHSRSQTIQCRTVDDIVFRRPVEIGSLLFLSSQIVYSSGPDLQVRVYAEVVNAETGSQEPTNDFHFTFHCGIWNMKQVIPNSYAESMLYVDGKRRYDER